MEQTAFPQVVNWTPGSVASGDAGLAVLVGYLDARQPGAGWDLQGHRLLTSAARYAEKRPGFSHGLFSGFSGIAVAACGLSRGASRYRRLTEHLDAVIVSQVEAAVADLRPRSTGVPVWSFDVISGLSGTGAYMLGRAEHDPGMRRALLRLLTALMDLWRAETDPPAWHTPTSAMEQAMARQHPHGNLNCGLAHGLPGVLAVLSLSRSRGVRLPGLSEVIEQIVDWLDGHRSDDAWGPNWPVAVPLSPSTGNTTDVGPGSHNEPSRSAWCYGAPGVARALWLAGEAVNHEPARSLAIATMAGIYSRPVPERRIDSPTFCHGVAGLLQITLRFSHDTGAPMFAKAAEDLLGQVLAAYDPGRPVGYYSVEPGGARVDQPGLLDGAAGVALTLLAASAGPEPGWDRLFLLS